MVFRLKKKELSNKSTADKDYITFLRAKHFKNTKTPRFSQQQMS